MTPNQATLLIQVAFLCILLSLRCCQPKWNFPSGILGGKVMELLHIFSCHSSLCLLAHSFPSQILWLVCNAGLLVKSTVTYVDSLEEVTIHHHLLWRLSFTIFDAALMLLIMWYSGVLVLLSCTTLATLSRFKSRLRLSSTIYLTWITSWQKILCISPWIALILSSPHLSWFLNVFSQLIHTSITLAHILFALVCIPMLCQPNHQLHHHLLHWLLHLLHLLILIQLLLLQWLPVLLAQSSTAQVVNGLDIWSSNVGTMKMPSTVWTTIEQCKHTLQLLK